jgi:hypothetical protein
VKASAPPRLLIPALAAAAGVVVAHAVDYLVLFPAAGPREAYLHSTGHGYWSVAVAVATGAAALAVLCVAASAALRVVRGTRGRPPTRFRSLVVWQMAAFVALEAGERGLAGVSAGSVLHGRELWLGLLLQLPVAALIVWLLRGVDHAAGALAARVRWPGVRRPSPVLTPAVIAAPPRLLLASSVRPRGPPAAVV